MIVGFFRALIQGLVWEEGQSSDYEKRGIRILCGQLEPAQGQGTDSASMEPWLLERGLVCPPVSLEVESEGAGFELRLPWRQAHPE